MKYGEVILKFCPAKSPIETMQCTSDGQKLIIGQVATDEKTPTLSIVDINTGIIAKTIEVSDGFYNSVWHLVVDRYDKHLIYLKQVYNKYQIIIYNLITKEARIMMEVANDDRYKGFLISPQNELVIGIDNNIQFFDIEKNELIKIIQLEDEKKIIGDPHCVTSLAFSLDGNFLAICGLTKGEVILYDLQKEQIVNRLSGKFDYPRKIKFDPTGKYIFILDYWTHGMFIWELQVNSWYMEDVYSEHWQGITCLDFDKNNPKNIVMGMVSSVVLTINFEELEEVFSDEIHKARVYNVLITPDGKRLISSGEDWQIVVRKVE
jgi:WD40 repeat protein